VQNYSDQVHWVSPIPTICTGTGRGSSSWRAASRWPSRRGIGRNCWLAGWESSRYRRKRRTRAMARILKITLIKSMISRPEKHRQVLAGMGLTRLNQTVELTDTPAIRGMIRKRVPFGEGRGEGGMKLHELIPARTPAGARTAWGVECFRLGQENRRSRQQGPQATLRRADQPRLRGRSNAPAAASAETGFREYFPQTDRHRQHPRFSPASRAAAWSIKRL